MSISKGAKKPFKIEIHPGVVALFKGLFVVCLLYFLFKQGFLSIELTAQAFKKWDRVVPAALATGVATGLGVVRWQYLLRAQNIRLGWGRVLELSLVGNFFNIALPGAVSGDFVKAVYVGQDTQGQKAKAFGSILFDRVAGLSALVVVAAAALLLGLNDFVHSPVLSGIGFILGFSAVAVG